MPDKINKSCKNAEILNETVSTCKIHCKVSAKKKKN